MFLLAGFGDPEVPFPRSELCSCLQDPEVPFFQEGIMFLTAGFGDPAVPFSRSDLCSCLDDLGSCCPFFQEGMGLFWCPFFQEGMVLLPAGAVLVPP